MLKKLSIGLLAAIVVAYVAAAWIMGGEIEQRVGGAVALLNERIPTVRVVDAGYRRGVFSSAQTLTVETLAPSPLRFTLHNVIRHGPVCGWTCIGLARIDSQLDFGEPLRTVLAGAFGPLPPLVAETRLGLLGGGVATLSSPAIRDSALAEGGHLASDGLIIDSRFGADYDSYRVHGTLPHVLYSAQERSVELTGGTLDLRARRVSPSLYAGDQSVTLARIDVGARGIGAVGISDINLATHTSVDDGFMAMSTLLGTGAGPRHP